MCSPSLPRRFAGHSQPASIILRPGQYMSYSSLALGSALAMMLYPDAVTGTPSAASDRVIHRDAALMPAYDLLLGLVALLGYFAIAAGIHTANSSSAVPLLLTAMFPRGSRDFPGCDCHRGAGAGGDHVHRDGRSFHPQLIWRAVSPLVLSAAMTGGQEAATAKLVSLPINLGALAFVLLVRAQFAIELQLLGGVWIFNVSGSCGRPLHPVFFIARDLLCDFVRGHGRRDDQDRFSRGCETESTRCTSVDTCMVCTLHCPRWCSTWQSPELSRCR